MSLLQLPLHFILKDMDVSSRLDLIFLTGTSPEQVNFSFNAFSHMIVGWFTAMFPVCLTIGGDSIDLDYAIRTVKEQLRAIPSGGISYGHFRNDPSQILNETGLSISSLISFNYLGHTTQNFDDELLVDVTSQKNQIFRAIDINGFMLDQILKFSFSFAPSIEDGPVLSSLFVHSLESLVADCTTSVGNCSSPSDFPFVQGLTIKDIDELLPRENLEDVYPLTPLQEGLLWTSLFNRTSEEYITQLNGH